MDRRKSFGACAAALALLPAVPALAAPIPEGATYVALGSSYAAGPGITALAPDSPGRCGQSTDNYPRQLAAKLKLHLVDRSCGGATTVDILTTGPLGLAPQLDGLSADTRLVTVTIGGNDVRYMADFAVAVCRLRAQALPEAARARACAAPADFDLNRAFGAADAGLRAIAAEVRKRAPQARLVFVDYVTVLPPKGACATLAISVADADALRARASRLADLTARVAHETHADLLKASALTQAHDACAPEPWVEGFVPPGGPPTERPRASFHPKLPAMTAIATSLARLLQD